VGSLRSTVGAVDDAVVALEKAFLIAVHAAIFGLVVAGVVLRYAFNDPLTWAEELIVGLFTWMVFVGASAALRSQMHIRIDVLARVCAHPKLAWLNLLTLGLGLAVIGVALWACAQQVMQEAAVMTPMLDVSKAWFVMAMPVGLAGMALHALRLWLDGGAAAVFRGESETVVQRELP
jgi:TRAP-type C4-dicarboxylate transport system permease small subunit